MKSKNYPVDIKNKSLEEAKLEIINILDEIDESKIELEQLKIKYARITELNNHIQQIFKKKTEKIKDLKAQVKKNNDKKK